MSERIHIVSLSTQSGAYYQLGKYYCGYHIASITDTDKCGQMSRVPWYRVTLANGSFLEVNAAAVESVEYEVEKPVDDQEDATNE